MNPELFLCKCPNSNSKSNNKKRELNKHKENDKIHINSTLPKPVYADAKEGYDKEQRK